MTVRAGHHGPRTGLQATTGCRQGLRLVPRRRVRLMAGACGRHRFQLLSPPVLCITGAFSLRDGQARGVQWELLPWRQGDRCSQLDICRGVTQRHTAGGGPHPGGGQGAAGPAGGLPMAIWAGRAGLPHLGRGGSRVLPPQVAKGWRAAGTGGRPRRRNARSTRRPRTAGPRRSWSAPAATAAMHLGPPGAAPAAAGSSSHPAQERGHTPLGPRTQGRFPGRCPGPPRTVHPPARTKTTSRHRD